MFSQQKVQSIDSKNVDVILSKTKWRVEEQIFWQKSNYTRMRTSLILSLLMFEIVSSITCDEDRFNTNLESAETYCSKASSLECDMKCRRALTSVVRFQSAFTLTFLQINSTFILIHIYNTHSLNSRTTGFGDRRVRMLRLGDQSRSVVWQSRSVVWVLVLWQT